MLTGPIMHEQAAEEEAFQTVKQVAATSILLYFCKLRRRRRPFPMCVYEWVYLSCGGGDLRWLILADYLYGIAPFVVDYVRKLI